MLDSDTNTSTKFASNQDKNKLFFTLAYMCINLSSKIFAVDLLATSTKVFVVKKCSKHNTTTFETTLQLFGHVFKARV